MSISRPSTDCFVEVWFQKSNWHENSKCMYINVYKYIYMYTVKYVSLYIKKKYITLQTYSYCSKYFSSTCFAWVTLTRFTTFEALVISTEQHAPSKHVLVSNLLLITQYSQAHQTWTKSRSSCIVFSILISTSSKF